MTTTDARARILSERQVRESRFWSKVNIVEVGCWEWTGYLDSCGYGRVQKYGKEVLAHRLSVIFSGREIPRGMVVDHVCCNPACVRPDHLEIVTPRENIVRGALAEVSRASR